ncbi:unnamed protein product [Periconia digitata]|uniref:Uncharacterized protein n=1 Tax=Periconia digitata TaxID=1303443 RepID=A0A9W4UL87_9PLEO|nr:unnamed protein product [Periconia digitata]
MHSRVLIQLASPLTPSLLGHHTARGCVSGLAHSANHAWLHSFITTIPSTTIIIIIVLLLVHHHDPYQHPRLLTYLVYLLVIADPMQLQQTDSTRTKPTRCSLRGN